MLKEKREDSGMDIGFWEKAVVTEIRLAIHVPPDPRITGHANRYAHGFVLNDPKACRRYIFSDGTVMDTAGGDLFYLPRGSTYRFCAQGGSGSCHAVNFDLAGNGADRPFCMHLRDTEALRRLFAEASRLCEQNPPFWQQKIRGILSDMICRMGEETRRAYVPGNTQRRLLPAEECIARRYTDPSLTVTELARLCGISEVYFRRLFSQVHGISPAAYIAELRTERARQLLASGQFSAARTAELCGYGDPASFSRDFRRRTGRTPGEFKKSVQKTETDGT
ncbi:MAG: helix-turn-helix transcriptional regulator [Clostridia bacterium]|nr:helix-turn-helix transcriptional regulator [Clostridia bacterium]